MPLLQRVHLVAALALAAAIALLPLDLSALFVLGTLAAAVALLDPLGAAALLVLSVPAQELVELPGGLSVTQAALLLGVASLALHTLARPDEPLRLGRLFPPLALFLWALALAAVLTPFSRSEALRETARWATVPLAYLLALRGVRGAPWRMWVLVGCLLLAPAVDAVVGLVQFWFGIAPESFLIGARARAYGTIGQPNSFAGYMNQGWPLAAGVAIGALLGHLAGVPRRATLWALAGSGVALALTGAALLASFSRGGWVGALGGAAALTIATAVLLPHELRGMARRLALTAGAGVVALVILGGGGLLPNAVAGRLSSLAGNLRLFDARGADITAANFAVVERMAHIQAAWFMIERYPLTGVGPGNYTVAYETPPAAGERPINVRPWYESRGHAHNYYLHIAAETGLVGLGAYLTLIGATLAQAVRAVRAAPTWAWRGVAAGAAGVVVAVATHNLFENLHVLNMGLQLGAIWALLVAAEAPSEEQPL
jgi:O-antigen ligase